MMIYCLRRETFAVGTARSRNYREEVAANTANRDFEKGQDISKQSPTDTQNQLWKQSQTEQGQGSVEYLGIIAVVVALVLALVTVANTWGNQISAAITEAIAKLSGG